MVTSILVTPPEKFRVKKFPFRQFNLYDFLFPNMQLEFLKYIWTSSSGSPKFARVARKNPAWLRPQGPSKYHTLS